MIEKCTNATEINNTFKTLAVTEIMWAFQQNL